MEKLVFKGVWRGSFCKGIMLVQTFSNLILWLDSLTSWPHHLDQGGRFVTGIHLRKQGPATDGIPSRHRSKWVKPGALTCLWFWAATSTTRWFLWTYEVVGRECGVVPLFRGEGLRRNTSGRGNPAGCEQSHFTEFGMLQPLFFFVLQINGWGLYMDVFHKQLQLHRICHLPLTTSMMRHDGFLGSFGREIAPQETFAALANLPSRAGANMQAQIKVRELGRYGCCWPPWGVEWWCKNQRVVLFWLGNLLVLLDFFVLRHFDPCLFLLGGGLILGSR